MLTRSLITLGLAAFVTGELRAQSFNLDYGQGSPGPGNGLPSNLYGGAANQTGFWQNADLANWSPGVHLVDVNGTPTAVPMPVGWPSQSFFYDTPTTVGDDGILLDDFKFYGGPQTVTTIAFAHLAAGDYVVYTYALDPSGYVTRISVSNSADPPQDVGGTWSGVLVQGVDYARHRVCGVPQDGGIRIHFTDVGSLHSRTCNGVQLVHRAPAGVFCAPVGPTAGSCLPTIAASSNPNVDQSNACSITVAQVDGQRAGLFFYGVSGAQQVPWCAGGNSFLCVKSPVQRTPIQSSSGTAGLCDGSFALDWSAYQLAHAGALGTPWAICDRAQVQAWFRDPGSCKSTFLTPALELVYTL